MSSGSLMTQWTESLIHYFENGDLPAWAAHKQLAPQGRSKELSSGAFPASAKKAAVLLCIEPGEEGIPGIHLIQRSTHPRDKHSGQISFPGGQWEEEDENMWETATREYREEMGVQTEFRYLGPLTPLYIPPSNFVVYPFVASSESCIQPQPDASEVASFFRLPLSHLAEAMQSTKLEIQLPSGLKTKAMAFRHESEVIWGATAMILNEFIVILKEI